MKKEINIQIMKEQSSGLDLTALVLCGGLGTRLREKTNDQLSKVLYPIAGRPMIEYSIKPFYDARIAHIVFLTAHLNHTVVDYFRGNAKHNPPDGVAISFSVEEFPTGILSAVQLALKENVIDTMFSISDGDIIRLGLNIADLYLFNQETRAITTVVATTVPPANATEYHGIRVNKNMKVVSIVNPPRESSPDILTLTGMVLCRPEVISVLKDIDSSRYPNWTDLLKVLFLAGEMDMFAQSILYLNLNTPDSVDMAEQILSQGQ